MKRLCQDISQVIGRGYVKCIKKTSFNHLITLNRTRTHVYFSIFDRKNYSRYIDFCIQNKFMYSPQQLYVPV